MTHPWDADLQQAHERNRRWSTEANWRPFRLTNLKGAMMLKNAFAPLKSGPPPANSADFPAGETTPIVATLGRQDRTQLKIHSVDLGAQTLRVDMYEAGSFRGSCRLRSDHAVGFRVDSLSGHLVSEQAVHQIIAQLLTVDRFVSLLGHRRRMPLDSLWCGVSVGGCTFAMHELDGGKYIAVFSDGEESTQESASADDWNELRDAWDSSGARYGDADRVRIAEGFFRSRGWVPAGVRICSSSQGQEIE
jgi:hypothetical protein